MTTTNGPTADLAAARARLSETSIRDEAIAAALAGRAVIDIDIPGAPTAKGRPRFSRRSGRTYTPAATERAEQTLAGRALVALQDHRARLPLRGALRVDVDLVMPIPASWSSKKKAQALSGVARPTSRPDLDNLVKLALDALNGIAWVDDAQIVESMTRKVYGAIPCTRIRIVEVTS